ncbi:aminotransferase class V-fold PLP-dependent enzyme [Natronospira bacteriovora]|uniref:cysteine desulfurase n=1 Tax=Natronospira bacteriovora TaxID=3069753 RepID=A0ABU0W3X4_9GAMM|nr:aminotransferase class V-fold PLP-dependent enzyme [Natronospira sp. AB-CW4]MDQ2068719.1 aminotransferase class V-fold PLP-dependent enzyme [Natronospira sp. AB-CW4]
MPDQDAGPIYLDYAATTPADPRVVADMMECLGPDGCYANPASDHPAGRAARERVEQAREQVARLIGAEPREVIFTSGATESNNLAITGAARFHRDRGRHIVTSPTEHKAVVDVCRSLEREGFEITWLEPDRRGLVDAGQLRAALRDDTILVSLMHVNNEIGVTQDVAGLAAIARERGVLFHVDAAQSAGKLPIRLDQWPVDLLSLSAHKFYGPKGVGALFLRRRPRARVEALMHGGGHERGLRSGTLATHQIVGLGRAAEIAREEQAGEHARLQSLRQRLLDGLLALSDVSVNGHTEQCVPGILNLHFGGLHGEALKAWLEPHLAVSGGSACTSAHVAPSYVLRALGRSDAEAERSLRLSLGRFTTEAEVEQAIAVFREAVPRLRALSPRAGDSSASVVSG